MRHWIVLALLASATAALPGCNPPAQQETHPRTPDEPSQTVHSRPTNQVAVLTVWAEAEKLEPTALSALRDAEVELPWGIEDFGAPEPSSRYVMFHDPAGNLIEVVEWL